MDGRILHITKDDIADILQMANGPENLFMQQHNNPENLPEDQDEHPTANTAETGLHQSCRPVSQPSIDAFVPPSFDRATPTSLDGTHRVLTDRHLEFGLRAYDRYGARKFKWEQKDEYGVYRDEFGYVSGLAGEIIPVTKEDIRKIRERASLFAHSYICLPEHAASFTETRLPQEIYTKDEINELASGIFGAQERLGEELQTLVDDTYQPLDRGFNELYGSMAEMRIEIEALIDANHVALIDIQSPQSSNPAQPESSAKKDDEWEIAYINTKINDVYNPLNNNVDWLNKRIDLLQQDLDEFRKKDQCQHQQDTSIDICTSSSIDSKFAAMEDRLQSYEDMHNCFTSPIMRYLDSLSRQMIQVQKDVGTLQDQLGFQEE
ncbi:hypothetical protein Bca101_026387 [Brassica carinata]